MEILQVKNLEFCYPDAKKNALNNLSFSINAGEFIVICGESGCGKSTLLKLLKKEVAPAGIKKGNILFRGVDVENMSHQDSSKKIGYVAQKPDGALVTEKVYSELAFGLENLCYDNNCIRMKVSETAISFGIESLFREKVEDLSGGQKQLVTLASVLVMEPMVLLLDEPTSKLDRIAAEEFINIIQKLSQNYGVTIIIAEHNLEEVFSMADRIFVLDEGQLVIDEKPKQLYSAMKKNIKCHNMLQAMPSAVRIFADRNKEADCPLNVKEAGIYLEQHYNLEHLKNISNNEIKQFKTKKDKSIKYRFKNIWFRYEKDGMDILRGADLTIYQNTLYCLLGGNGSGKSTLLSIINGLYKPYRGHVENIKSAYMCQNPQLMFLKENIYEDLIETGYANRRSKQETQDIIEEYENQLNLKDIFHMHPYDLSGGEIQKAALMKILLSEADLILLDEPTKGMDAFLKKEFGQILKELLLKGKTILMVTHDVEFAAEYADDCSMIFDGEIFGRSKPKTFFEHNTYFTTYTNRIMRRATQGIITVSEADFVLNEYERMYKNVE